MVMALNIPITFHINTKDPLKKLRKMQELINADYGVKTHVTEKEKISNYKPRPKKYFLNIKMV
jgi:hypothetical protein